MKAIDRIPGRRMAWIGWGLAAVGIGVLLPWRLTAVALESMGSSPAGATVSEHRTPAGPLTAAEQRQAAERVVGADWQQRGLLSQADYVRLSTLGHTVVQTRALSDQDLDWLLARMAESPSAIVHSRVMGILSTLLNPPASQKQRINRAIAPLLRGPNLLDRVYADRVVAKLDHAPAPAAPSGPR